MFFIREYIFAYKLKNRLEYSIHFMLLNSSFGRAVEMAAKDVALARELARN